MRIFNSTDGDPMLLDSEDGLRAFQREFGAFLESSSTQASFPAEVSGSPEPYDEFLQGLRISRGATLRLTIGSDRWVELCGSPEALRGLCERVPQAGGDHVHWHCKPVSLIVEADEDWPGHRTNE